jgi:hypothetical protein
MVLLCILGAGTSDNGGSNIINAFVMSHEFVRNSLKAPSTADFQEFDPSLVTDLGEGRFRVSSYVCAQNSFGAKLRTRYTCTLKHLDGDNWILESLDLKE